MQTKAASVLFVAMLALATGSTAIAETRTAKERTPVRQPHAQVDFCTIDIDGGITCYVCEEDAVAAMTICRDKTLRLENTSRP